MYNWITKYQWIIILCILLFFLFVSINKKECFSVGFESDISISSNLFLDSSICKVDNGEDCNVDSDCKSEFCFYSFNDSLVKEDYIRDGVKGKCVNIDGNKPNNTDKLCISRNTDLEKYGPPYIENVYANALFKNDGTVTEENKNKIKDLYNEKFKDYNPKFYCNESTKCTSKKLDEIDDTTSDIYNICNNLKNIVQEFDTDVKSFDTNNEKNKFVCMKYLETGICE